MISAQEEGLKFEALNEMILHLFNHIKAARNEYPLKETSPLKAYSSCRQLLQAY